MQLYLAVALLLYWEPRECHHLQEARWGPGSHQRWLHCLQVEVDWQGLQDWRHPALQPERKQ